MTKFRVSHHLATLYVNDEIHAILVPLSQDYSCKNKKARVILIAE